MCKAFCVKRQNVKAKFSSDEDLSLNKAIEIRNATIVVKIVFHGNNKILSTSLLN